MKVTTLHPAKVIPSDDRRHAYYNLEPEVTDLVRMARLAELQLHNAVGELLCKDGKYIEAPDYEATDLAIFAVSQMAKMMEKFEELYYRAFETGGRG